ncbi:hypothetical protein GGI25_003195 [Coemansia spiralis]|uniref:Uncharacterized protein n=2 Tax=Coemansia TaxID=4863 RepID=A0A9W8KXT3_9FUNG|nr:hypothetical protein BX070DRAFT_155285 [Coemansia spiralis]KAJ1991834.1 hypothetical protein EDC05_003189 [Coemansia umbellata]KAJ2621885.1 hypothetical protein GGI26_003728 [Coemansia sp. RSA 1358]KAJ2677440.1 hypothetical protein GGI25_003195 [Coemansia spiralis]
MRTDTFLISLVLSAAVTLGTGAAADEANAGTAPSLHNKIMRIPKGLEHHVKRASPSSSTDGSDNNDNESAPKPSSTSASSSSTTPKATNASSSEQGPLEADNSDDNNANQSDGNSGDAANNQNANSSDDDQSDANVVTDAQGNPIVTDLDVSHWDLITPTGVKYLSGASRTASHLVAALGVAGVAVAGAALF